MFEQTLIVDSMATALTVVGPQVLTLCTQKNPFSVNSEAHSFITLL